MNEELKKLKGQLSSEWNKPKAKNVGRNGSGYYKGTHIDKVTARDPEKIRALHAEMNEVKHDMNLPRKATANGRGRTPVWHAEKKVKSYGRRGKVLSYLTKWMRGKAE